MTLLTLHVGLPKTGTSYLQTEVFPEFGVPYIHKRHGATSKFLISFLHRFFHATDAIEDADLNSAKSILHDKANAGSHMLLSDENISVTIGGVWKRGRITTDRFKRRLEELIKILAAIGIDCQLMICVRRQDEWLISRYAESAKNFPEFSAEHFDEFIRSNHIVELAEASLMNFARFFEAMDGIEILKDFQFFVYEDFEVQPAKFIDAMSWFTTGQKLEYEKVKPGRRNVSRSAANIWMLKGETDGAVELTTERSGLIMQHFYASNVLFANLSNLDVSKYGYTG